MVDNFSIIFYNIPNKEIKQYATNPNIVLSPLLQQKKTAQMSCFFDTIHILYANGSVEVTGFAGAIAGNAPIACLRFNLLTNLIER